MKTRPVIFRNLLASIVLTISIHCFGQPTYFTVRTTKKDKSLSFPIFSSETDSGTAEKINQLLQISELEIIKGFEKNDIFENVTRDNGTVYGGKVEISCEILNNSKRYLSLQFNESSCGMTCTYWLRYYNFNAGNGEMFQLKDLFTKSGYKIFSNNVSRKRVAEFKKQLSRLNSTQRDWLLEIIDCYESDNLEDFYIKDNTLFIDGENCFGKNQKGADIERVSKFKLSEFEKYLNEYGKAIFSLTKDTIAKFHSTSLPQIFEGKLAGNDIMLVLKNGYHNEMKGEYVYLKYGNGIFLNGELINGKLTLTERNNGYEETGHIDATFDGQQILGTWTNKDKTKHYKLALKRK